DEPTLDSRLIDTVAQSLAIHPGAGMSTLATPIVESRELFDENVVKVVLTAGGFASYFSRAAMPWVRGGSDACDEIDALPKVGTFLRHVGLYGYRTKILRKLTEIPASTHERAESLEQLRALSIGVPIHVTIVDGVNNQSVDTHGDLALAETRLRRGDAR